MENLILLIATSFLFRLSSNRKVKSHVIGDTGCSALLATEDELDYSLTSSGDKLFFHEFKEGKVTYGLICVQMSQEYSLTEAEKMLNAYIDQLKGPLYILHNTGIHQDVDWNSESSRTIIDYWQDVQKKDWKVKGYTNGKILAVLYVKNIGHADVTNQDHFLDSFHFNAVAV
jgi:hypothetical protein